MLVISPQLKVKHGLQVCGGGHLLGVAVGGVLDALLHVVGDGHDGRDLVHIDVEVTAQQNSDHVDDEDNVDAQYDIKKVDDEDKDFGV